MIYRHIVIPLDGSELAESVLPHLAGFTPDPQTQVDLVRAVPPVEIHYRAVVPLDTGNERQLNEFALKEARDYLEKTKTKLPTAYTNVRAQILQGRPADVIADYLNTSGADLLLMATHGRSGPSRWIWGSTAEKLLRSTCIPVFLVHPPGCGARPEGR